MASAVIPQREKIRFDYGRTETVILRHPTGKEVQGIYGAQFMFSTTDERIFFLDHEIAYQLEKCPGAANGEPISITRSKGPRNTTNWDIRPATAGRAALAPPAAEPESPLEAKLRDSIALAEQAKVVHAEAAQQPITTAQAKLLAALCVAIDSCVEAKAYAQRRGLPLEFTGEDVRCFANTILINGESGAR